MNVFVDFHHESLLESFILLFEKRLHWRVYRPIGLEWFHEGYWKINNIPETAAQFLQAGSQPYKDLGYPPLNERDALGRAVTLEQFKEMDFGIVIASIPQHIEPFKKLIANFKPEAKLIFHIGNAWSIEANSVKNVMASAVVRNIPGDVNFVQYHQEFPLEVFYPSSFKPPKTIYSYINCLNVVDLHKPDWELFTQLERIMPDWEFRSYGGQCRDGWCTGDQGMADKMRLTAFGFHCKSGGDGYGHVIHNLARSGVPLIVRKSDYIGKLAEPLLEDGVTCITVDDKTPEQIKDQVNEIYNTAKMHKQMNQNMANRFKEVVNFDKEFEDIVAFLDKLK